MLEVEIVYFHDEHIAGIFVHDEIFVEIVDTFQIIDRHLLLIVATSLLDILDEMRNGRTEINHEFRHLHHFHHRLEEFHVGFIIALVHIAHSAVVGCKDIYTFEDGTVLDDRLRTVLDFEQILESLLEIEHFHIECPSGNVLVIIIDIGVICHGFQEFLPTIVFGEHLGQRGLTATDVSCYCYIHLF